MPGPIITIWKKKERKKKDGEEEEERRIKVPKVQYF